MITGSVGDTYTRVLDTLMFVWAAVFAVSAVAAGISGMMKRKK